MPPKQIKSGPTSKKLGTGIYPCESPRVAISALCIVVFSL